MKRWITKGGKRVLINTTHRGIDSRYFKNDTTEYLTKHDLNKRYNIRPSFRHKPILKPVKKWYEEGWRHEIHRFEGTDFAVDVGNFGNGNFSFSVRKGQKEIFVIPPSLLKQAVSYGLATLGLPAFDMTIPIGIIEQSIKLYDKI
jgi:hypothetical protein